MPMAKEFVLKKKLLKGSEKLLPSYKLNDIKKLLDEYKKKSECWKDKSGKVKNIRTVKIIPEISGIFFFIKRPVCQKPVEIMLNHSRCTTMSEALTSVETQPLVENSVEKLLKDDCCANYLHGVFWFCTECIFQKINVRTGCFLWSVCLLIIIKKAFVPIYHQKSVFTPVLVLFTLIL